MISTRRLVPWCYTDDEGRLWPRGADLLIIVQTDDRGRPLVGGRPYQPLPNRQALPLPASRFLKLRSAVVENPETGSRRQLVIHSTDAPLWTGAAKTIPLWTTPVGSSQYGELLLYQVVRLNPEAVLELDSRVEATVLAPDEGGWDGVRGVAMLCRRGCPEVE